MNLLFLRGNIGKPGAGASPIRGHSNVQGDRTMGIWEKMPPEFLDKLGKEFSFTAPTKHGFDSVETMNAMLDGKVKFYMSLAGSLAAAISDSRLAEEGFNNVDMSVMVSTKLNHNHIITGKEALILPAIGRTEKDMQNGRLQTCSVEDTVCHINASHGDLEPISEDLRSDVAIICQLGEALAARGKMSGSQIPWSGFQNDYDTIRESIERVIPGFDNFDERLRLDEGFYLPHPPRDSRTFPTATGKATFITYEPEHLHVPEGRLLMQSMRAHDQHNSTIYGLGDRYRGIENGRFVLFINPEDIDELGLEDGRPVDIYSQWEGQDIRVLRGYRVVSYPTKKGCVAAYFPEANELVPRNSVGEVSNTPTYKQIVVRLEPGDKFFEGSRPVAEVLV